MGGPETALVIAAGDTTDHDSLPDADLVIAADSGADVARASGRAIDVLVGDLDSISPEALREAEERGVRIVAHPADKDDTDLELALALAVEVADRVHVIASATGRLDHTLTNIAILASPRFAAAEVEATIDGHHLCVVRDHSAIDGDVGQVVSLLPVGGPAHGVTTSGLLYPLDGETLEPTRGRGISNEVVAPPASVSLTGGVLIVIRPLGP